MSCAFLLLHWVRIWLIDSVLLHVVHIFLPSYPFIFLSLVPFGFVGGGFYGWVHGGDRRFVA